MWPFTTLLISERRRSEAIHGFINDSQLKVIVTPHEAQIAQVPVLKDHSTHHETGIMEVSVLKYHSTHHNTLHDEAQIV